MGAYTCEYGVVHKMCRCPKEHTIKCDQPVSHGGTAYVAGKSKTHAHCYRLAMGLLGKHEAHPSHLFWYTSSDGGHYLDTDPTGDDTLKDVRQWICPGRE